MTTKNYRTIAWSLILSLVGGFSILVYGSVDRALPPDVDPIWESADQIRHQIQDGSLSLKEGEAWSGSFHQYQFTLRRLPKDPQSTERYILQIRSTYDLLPSTTWRPSSWDLGFIAVGSGPDRKTFLVAAKRIKA